MVTPEGNAKILDLGLARASDDENPMTRPNSVVGTLDYASPEQLSNAHNADRRSDLYSLGCTMYFTLTGRAPFEGGDIINKMFKHRMEEPPPLEKITRGVPSAYATIIRKLMAKDPNDRYQTGQELQQDLRRWTDPASVKSIVGVEAEAARDFRPPPPEIDDDDLLTLSHDSSSSGVVLRDLGDDQATPAPQTRPTPVAKAAIVVAPPVSASAKPQGSWTDEAPWLLPFIVVICLLGALAIALIAAVG